MNHSVLVRGFLLGSLLVFSGCGGRASTTTSAPDIRVLNSSNPGGELDLAKMAASGKTTIFVFSSSHCPACQKMDPFMDKLAANRSDLAIRKLMIDRPGVNEIDFESPLAKQANLKAVPAFVIYDKDARLVAQGQRAREQVSDWYTQSEMFKQGQSDKGTADIMKDYEAPSGTPSP
mgnify:CR=1 FL=1